MAIYASDYDGFKQFEDALIKYEGNAEAKINDVLQGFGGDLIEEKIKLLLPVSGRNWRGKKRAAKYAEPFIRGRANLSVVVKTKTAYGYLYFPDDGTTTRKHVGEKYFMHGGAEDATPEILERCIVELTDIE